MGLGFLNDSHSFTIVRLHTHMYMIQLYIFNLILQTEKIYTLIGTYTKRSQQKTNCSE